MEEQKKRDLDALERRFAQAEAEVRAQQEKGKKRPHHHKQKLTQNVKNASTSGDFTPTPSKKGNISFSGHTAKEDVDANDPVYSLLLHPVVEHLMPNVAVDPDRRSAVDHLLHEFFQHGDAAEKYMQGSRSMKIDNWILLDNVVQRNGVSAAARFRNLQKHSKRSKKRMSLKQHKKCGTHHFSSELHKFELFKPMHEMWKSYITQLLKNVGKNQLPQCLLNADLHGAIVLVVSCKINSFIGVRGIMIRETAETLGIITEDNKFRVVPKRPSIFMFQADCWKVTVFGDKLASRTTVT